MSTTGPDARTRQRFKPSADALTGLRDAALSKTYVSLGSRRTKTPHEFYRYPARFSPAFASAAITAFTHPGELVLDPFVGGGTTLVEAMATGREAIGSDLNQLATFITTVKTTPLNEVELASIARWIGRLDLTLADDVVAPPFTEWRDLGYFKDLDDDAPAAIHRLIACALGSVDTVRSTATKQFIRCVILRTAQWALDMRREVPEPDEFRAELRVQGTAMLEVARDFADGFEDAEAPMVLTQALPGLAERPEVDGIDPALILTSPPYPGVYVLYHRWKLRGRREIPAPYWIADRRDGHGLSRYTMGARAEPTQRSYFAQLEAAFADLAKIATPRTTIVQIVGFNDGPSQLHRYLDAMTTAGFTEKLHPELATGEDGRLWRDVPNRRWWNEARAKKGDDLHTSREVVLVHHPS